MKLSRLDVRTFEIIASRTRMGPKAKAMAAAVLVEQQSLAASARRFNVSKQRVEVAVNTVRKAHHAVAPEMGWGRASFEMPLVLVAALANFVEALEADADDQHSQLVLPMLVDALGRAEAELGGQSDHADLAAARL